MPRGGSRIGSGRPAGCPTKAIRVPVPCLPFIEQILQGFKEGRSAPHIIWSEGKNVPETKEPAPLTLEPDAEPEPETLLPAGAKKATRKDFDRLPLVTQKRLIKQFGSAYTALQHGVWIKGKEVYTVD